MKRNFLKENKSFFLFVIALIMGTVGGILQHGEIIIAVALSFAIIVLLKMDNRKRCGVIKTILVAITILVAVIFHIFYCKNSKEDVNNTLPEETTQQDTTSTDNTAPVVNTAPVSTETTTSVNNTVNRNTRRPNITDEERAESQDLNPIYGGGEGDNANKNGGKQNADSAISPEMVGKDGVESEGYQKEAEEANEKEDIKAEQNQDNSFTIDADNTKEEEEEAGNANGSTDAGDENTSWKDTANGDNVTNYEPVKVEDNVVVDKEEQPTTDNKVETEEPATDNKVETEEPAADNKVETEEPAADNKVETEEPATDNKVETEEPATDDKVEIEQPVKVEKLSVEALDGNSTTVGSSVQYKITGEDVSFEGLEGFSYTYNNGILTIETGTESTVLTFNVLDATGDSIMIDLTINGIVK